MSNSYTSYRKDRYHYHTARKKGNKYFVTSLLIIATVLLCATIYLGLGKEKVVRINIEQKVEIAKMESELAVLRTINPYKVATHEVIQKAVAKVDLFPGWVTRVYPVPESIETTNLVSDMGTFVMNETTFSLASHQRYGIKQPSKSMYRLSGLMPSYIKGRHQIGLQLSVSDKNTKEKEGARMGSCYTQVIVNHKRVIDRKLHLIGNYDPERVITGEVELDKGLFPISALIYCDQSNHFETDDVNFSITFRDPAQHSLVSSRDAVFHIYSPENLNDLL